MWKNKKAVIFDLDGTLIDSMWVWSDVDINYLGSFGLEVPEDLNDHIEGMSFTECAFYFKERFALPRTVKEIEEDWNRMAIDRYRTRVPLKEGARAFITALREEGIRMGIATSNSRELAEAVLDAHGIAPYFDSIHTALEVPRGKPAPDIYLLAARSLRAEPCDCLVFEDVPSGITAAREAGMEVCAVYDAHSADRAEEIRRMADHYIKDFSGLLSAPREDL